MKRNFFLFVGLSVIALSAMGCRAGGQYQQPVLGGYQQPVLPNMQQTQQGMGQFGRNVGHLFTNNLLNRGVNFVINRAIAGF